MLYRTLLACLREWGIGPVHFAYYKDDLGETVYLGDPEKVVYPELIPPGAIPIYLDNGDDTILEDGHAQHILDSFRP